MRTIRAQASATHFNFSQPAISRLRRWITPTGINVHNIDADGSESISAIRDEGIVAFRKDSIFRSTKGAKLKNGVMEQKATALAQLLYGWGLLDHLSYDDQETLIRDILEIVFLEEGK